LSDLRHFVHRPGNNLRRYVREILWVNSKYARSQVLLPETTLTLVLRQSGTALLNDQDLPGAVVSGLQQRTRLVGHGAGSSIVIVRFTEVGGSAMLHDRVDHLYNRTVSLDSVLLRREIEKIQNILVDLREIRKQIPAMERFLANLILSRSRVSSRGRISLKIEAAAQMICASEGRTSIAAIARQAAMSQSSLERQFREVVGATPKRFSRLTRLQHVCRLWNAGKSLTRIASEAGYSDQPHLVHDFQLFTGTSPQEFFRNTAPRNLPTFYK
jgi:AraC-like DNA-binding protein